MVFHRCCFNVDQHKVGVWCFQDVVLIWASIRSMYGVSGCCFNVGQYKVNVWCFIDVVLMLASIRSMYGVSSMLFYRRPV